MRADSLILRVGPARDVLVPIEADSTDTAALLRVVFEEWLDTDPTIAEQLAEVTPALSVNLATQAATDRGPRALPHLRRSKDVLFRANEPIAVVHQLAWILGGIHERATRDARPWVNLRLFTHGGRAVLVDAAPPHLLADRELAALDVHERCHWGVIVADGTLSAPPPLAGRWDAAGLPPAGEVIEWGPQQLVGVVALDPSPAAAPAFARAAGRSERADWFRVLAATVEAGRFLHVADRAALRRAITSLLRS